MTPKNRIFFWFGIEVFTLVLAMVAFAWPLVAGTYDITYVTKAAAVSAVLVLLSIIPTVMWHRAAREFHRSRQATDCCQQDENKKDKNS